MTTKTWEEISTTLVRLTQDPALVSMRATLERIQRAANAQLYDLEAFDLLISATEQMASALKAGSPLNEVIAGIYSGAYVQPGMDVNNLYQAKGNIIQVFFKDLQTGVPADQQPNALFVPVILVVMTRAEAEALASGHAFASYPPDTGTEFEHLHSLLQQYGNRDWVQRYRVTPNEWRPFGDPAQAKSIEQILQEKLLRVEREKGYKKHIKPRFIELRSLNRAENRSTLRQLREFGSIVILDAISLRHPLIQQEYRHALLDAFPATVVASFAPDASFFKLTQRVTIVIEHYIDLEFHRRHDEDADARCARITSETDINRLIISQVEHLLPDDEKPEQRRRPMWFDNMNTSFSG